MSRRFINYLLARLARKIIRKYQPRVISITGSVGKTSTKEAIFSALKTDFNVRKNIKDHNTKIGIPLTIIGTETGNRSLIGWFKVWLKAQSLLWGYDECYPDILVLEMAADHPGDISHLVKIAPCETAIVTAVSESHLEFFKNLEAVKEEKQVLVSHLTDSATAILNIDDELVSSMQDKTNAKILTYGFLEGADLRAFDFSYVHGDDNSFSHLNFKLSYKEKVILVELRNALSKTHVYSFLSAVAVGLIYGLDLDELVSKMKNLRPPKGRMNFLDGIKHTKLIDDTYNSSPRAAKVALEVLSKLYVPGKKIAVLGDMLELGSFTEQAHQDLGKLVCELGVDMLITVGERSQDIVRGAESVGMNKDKMFHFDDVKIAGEFLQDKMEKNDLVLIKASQGMRFEKIVKEVMAEPMRAGELLVRQYGGWIES
ncbi:MAG: UDP-N-acetylmuramoyl-tripeptide--D-alanyl-D-alanine ligase [Patescibacteria group bacterium]